MKIDILLDEYERLNIIEEDEEFKKFYYFKLNEWEIDTPNDLEDINEFFTELHEEWVEELDTNKMIDIYSSISESYEEVDKINLLFLNKFINEKFKKVVRGGKIIRKKICKDGYVLKDGKCVKQTTTEKRKLSKIAKKRNRKLKGKKAITTRKRLKSMKKGKNLR